MNYTGIETGEGWRAGIPALLQHARKATKARAHRIALHKPKHGTHGEHGPVRVLKPTNEVISAVAQSPGRQEQRYEAMTSSFALAGSAPTLAEARAHVEEAWRAGLDPEQAGWFDTILKKLEGPGVVGFTIAFHCGLPSVRVNADTFKDFRMSVLSKFWCGRMDTRTPDELPDLYPVVERQGGVDNGDIFVAVPEAMIERFAGLPFEKLFKKQVPSATVQARKLHCIGGKISYAFKYGRGAKCYLACKDHGSVL